jgi:hypothetical protein
MSDSIIGNDYQARVLAPGPSSSLSLKGEGFLKENEHLVAPLSS